MLLHRTLKKLATFRRSSGVATENLIAALVADSPTTEAPIARTFDDCRRDRRGDRGVGVLHPYWASAQTITTALETVRYQSKFLVTVALLVPALPLVWHYARPTSNELGWIALLLIISSILAIACTLEMAAVPSADWAARLQGTGPTKCFLSIPFLSIAPLSALLYGLSQGAPTKPVVAGSVAGLASAAFAATLYASNCVNDSPLFCWRPGTLTAIAFVTIASLDCWDSRAPCAGIAGEKANLGLKQICWLRRIMSAKRK